MNNVKPSPIKRHSLSSFVLAIFTVAVFSITAVGCSSSDVPQPDSKKTNKQTEKQMGALNKPVEIIDKAIKDADKAIKGDDKTIKSIDKRVESADIKIETTEKTIEKSAKAKAIDSRKTKLDLRLDAQTLSSIQENKFNQKCNLDAKGCLWQDRKAPLPELFSQKEEDNRFSVSGDIERDGEKELLDIKAIKGGEVSIEYKFK